MCDINIDDCANNPCQNEGQCIDAIDDYNCVCEPGFTGKNCQHRVDFCKVEPCQNGGTCSSKNFYPKSSFFEIIIHDQLHS